MGTAIDSTEFTDEDFRVFTQKLRDNLFALRKLLNNPDFGSGPPSFGAELEVYIIDKNANPLAINTKIFDQLNDPQLALELVQFNLEYNFKPAIGDSPFSNIKAQIDAALEKLQQSAHQFGGRILPIGIIPTLKKEHLGPKVITDQPRYHALANGIRKLRGCDFEIDIDGQDPLSMTWADVTPEGANTSFQFHYRVPPKEFADSFNAAQLVSPLILALGANSPTFLGHRLWQETRIALFKQSIDYRITDLVSTRIPPRVNFGHGWLRKDAYDLFAEGVFLYPPLLPVINNEQPSHCVNNGDVPSLHELVLHQSSIWSWNRPVYDHNDGGHLRLELRALPAGPTSLDMVSNAALFIGLIEGIKPYINQLLPGIPFNYAKHNFYRAAQDGLSTIISWPGLAESELQERPIVEILEELLPLAADGLERIGIAKNEIQTYLDIARATLESQMNGATWQLKVFGDLIKKHSKEETLRVLTERYYEEQCSGKPVHEWSTRC